jgi:hypothetical protein
MQVHLYQNARCSASEFWELGLVEKWVRDARRKVVDIDGATTSRDRAQRHSGEARTHVQIDM